MLLVFDTKGEIEQIITLGDNPAMVEAYQTQGKQTYQTDDMQDYSNRWMNKGILMFRPTLKIEPFTLQANVEAQIAVPGNTGTVNVVVLSEKVKVGEDSFTGDVFPIEIDQPGTYQFLFTPAFPTMPLIMNVEVT